MHEIGKIENVRKNAIIVFPEIYGINKYIDNWVKFFSQRGYDVFCMDLYGEGKKFDYDQEDNAYDYFRSFVGYELSREIQEFVKEKRLCYEKLLLFGSSIGATLSWKLAEKSECDGMIGYYGGRIRDYLTVNPCCPSLLIFSENEQGFVVSDIVGILNRKEKVKAVVLPGNHGFGDPFGRNFNLRSGKKAFIMVKCFLDEIEQSNDKE